jgi:oligopeptide/dipeptide ABC transporter ATP-binding protein
VNAASPRPLIEASALSRHFLGRRRTFFAPRRSVRAVDDVTLSIFRNETLGLVGESGSGKSTVGRLLLAAIPPSGGSIRFDGEDITQLPPRRWRILRREMQLVQQNPATALDPRITIGGQLDEALTIHRIGAQNERRALTMEILSKVGLRSDFARRFPHELSGGQLQRVAIARALLVRPQFLVCDEPVSALDPSVQAQVLNLLRELRTELNLTILFISHDLNVIRYISDRIAVLYLGRIAEIGTRDEVLNRPQHPYSQALLKSIPVPDPHAPPPAPEIYGEPPDPAFPPSGCRFHTRCPLATAVCRSEAPALLRVSSETHMVACHHVDRDNQGVGATA